MVNKTLEKMERSELIQLIEIYSKNWLAMDGVWFQSVERKFGMAELSSRPGIDGLKRALQLRLYANINEDEIIVDGNTLIYRTLDRRVQNARKRKGMEFHPCKAVGIIEYTGFAKTIDDRFECEALSCYPEITDETCNCSWKFILKDN